MPYFSSLKSQPLNHELYGALYKVRGYATIIHAGEKRIPSKTVPGGYRTQQQWGEEYKLNCPLCGEEGRQLVVSYEYGVQNPNDPDDYNLHLFRCFKNNCQRDHSNHGRLWQLVNKHGYRRQRSLELAPWAPG